MPGFGPQRPCPLTGEWPELSRAEAFPRVSESLRVERAGLSGPRVLSAGSAPLRPLWVRAGFSACAVLWLMGAGVQPPALGIWGLQTDPFKAASGKAKGGGISAGWGMTAALALYQDFDVQLGC